MQNPISAKLNASVLVIKDGYERIAQYNKTVRELVKEIERIKAACDAEAETLQDTLAPLGVDRDKARRIVCLAQSGYITTFT